MDDLSAYPIQHDDQQSWRERVRRIATTERLELGKTIAQTVYKAALLLALFLFVFYAWDLVDTIHWAVERADSKSEDLLASVDQFMGAVSTATTDLAEISDALNTMVGNISQFVTAVNSTNSDLHVMTVSLSRLHLDLHNMSLALQSSASYLGAFNQSLGTLFNSVSSGVVSLGGINSSIAALRLCAARSGVCG
jgi:methyl-accepting chemotaxis protein